MNIEYTTWTDPHRGQVTQITAKTKYDIIEEYAVRYGLKDFVETGTCYANCLIRLKHNFDRMWSIELDEQVYLASAGRVASYPNIYVLQGDSAIQLPKILPTLHRPTLFWLDAHGENWIGPIVKEVEAIFASPVKGIILIDDMDFILDTLPEDPRWKFESRQYGIVRLINVE